MTIRKGPEVLIGLLSKHLEVSLCRRRDMEGLSCLGFSHFMHTHACTHACTHTIHLPTHFQQEETPRKLSFLLTSFRLQLTVFWFPSRWRLYPWTSCLESLRYRSTNRSTTKRMFPHRELNMAMQESLLGDLWATRESVLITFSC